MNKSLFDRLIEYNNADIYPFCMPGHKRKIKVEGLTDPYIADITEVEGFDDLHKPEGIIRDIMDEAAAVYGCRHVFISVNGSTACNLAAITAVPEGGPLLVASNCHRSVFNGLKINRREHILIEPDMLEGTSVCGGISPEAVSRAFAADPGIKALVLTSPTYEGFLSDIRKISEIVHKYGAMLIVDEAHGAHLPFSDGFPESALNLGADIVVQSMHKTMGSLNQTAWLFAPGADDAFAQELHQDLLMYTTTSPSYLLMASMQEALRRASGAQGREAFEEFLVLLKKYAKEFSKLENIKFIDKSIEGCSSIVAADPSRLVFTSTRIKGEELMKKVLEHGVQLERYGADFVTAIASVYDTQEGFERLLAAMKDIDMEIAALRK